MTALNPDISIIVPVYNVEKYLVRCLDSIFNQEFSGSFEVIAVEDASTDNSLHVLKSYQKNETRLKIIEHRVNKKLSIARATGMKAAKGDYIMHVDSDDWLLPKALENLIRTCIESKADVVVFNHVKENNKGERIFINSIKRGIITTDKLKVQQHFFGAPWNKIVKRSLTENMIYGQVGVNNTEDLLYATEILVKAESILLIPENYYTYFANTDSLTHIINPEQYLKNQIVILEQLQKIVSKFNTNKELIENILNYFNKWIYLQLIKIHFEQKEKLPSCRNLIRDLFQLPIMTKSHIRSLELSMKNRFVCLFEVYKRLGLRMALGIILKSFSLKN